MKKRILGIILAALMLLASTVSVFAADDVHPGDANLDGRLNLSDCSLILKYIAKWDVEINHDLSDVNDDGKINLSDASLILKYIAKWDVVLK